MSFATKSVGRAHNEMLADIGQGDAARETLRDTVWAHINPLTPKDL
jgi:hypothetical protein